MKCHYCNDTGMVACRSRDGQYAFAGPVPDDAKGYFDADCWYCDPSAACSFSAVANVLCFDIEPLSPELDDVEDVSVRPGSPSNLARKIAIAYEATTFDADARETGRAALYDAQDFVNLYLPNSGPTVLWSDDGLLTLQWRKGDTGLILIFPGDNTATFSVKEPGGFYSTNGREFVLTKGLPSEIRHLDKKRQRDEEWTANFRRFYHVTRKHRRSEPKSTTVSSSLSAKP